MRAWVTHHSLCSLEDFLMCKLAHLQYGDITVCFRSRDPRQPDLVSLKHNSIRHLVMLRKYIHHSVQESHLSVASDDTDHVLEPSSFMHITFPQYMSPPLLHLHLQSQHLPPELPFPLPLTQVQS